jgi:hypothetical protein
MTHFYVTSEHRVPAITFLPNGMRCAQYLPKCTSHTDSWVFAGNVTLENKNYVKFIRTLKKDPLYGVALTETFYVTPEDMAKAMGQLT